MFLFFHEQLKKGGGGSGEGNKEAEEAEQLLLTNKPLTELTPLLTQLVGFSDTLLDDKPQCAGFFSYTDMIGLSEVGF